MRLSLLLTLLLMAVFSVAANAQKMSVRIEVGTLDEAFQQIMRNSDIQLVYNTDVAADIRCSGRTFEQQDVTEILTALLANTNLTYKFENTVYIISEKPQQQEQVQILKKISGKVLDETGEPLPGAVVTVKGSTKKPVYADVTGAFELINIPANATLVVFFLGYETLEYAVNSRAMMDIVLNPSATRLEEVVVTGYQSISREKMTGATATVTSTALSERYTPNIVNNLEGRVAGLVTYGGQTTIRGASSLNAITTPLLVVDGLPIEGSLDDINPYDVESINVLKDAAAAAIYGARASNGIIVITTKKAPAMAGDGKEGSKKNPILVDVSANFTVYQKRNLNYADNFYMNAAQQIKVESDYYDYYFFSGEMADPIGGAEGSLSSGYGSMSPVNYAYYQLAKGMINRTQFEQQLAALAKNNFAQEYADNVLQNRFLQQYNVAVRSRAENFQSNLVLNYRHDNTGIKNAADNQVTIFYKGSYDMAKWLTANFSINGILSTSKESNSAYATNPFNVPAYYKLLNDVGSYNYYASPDPINFYSPQVANEPGLRSMNFNHLEELNYDQLKTDRRNMRYHGEILFKIIPGLTASGQFIYETERQEVANYSEADSYVMRFLRNIYTTKAGDTYSYMLPKDGGKLATTHTKGDYWTARGQLDFNRTFDEKHAINFLAGLEFRQTKYLGTKGLLLGYDDQLQQDNTISVNFNDLSNYEKSDFFAVGYLAQDWAFWSHLAPYIGPVTEALHRYGSGYANLTYTYDGRYNFFGSFRKDYADIYGADTKFRGKPLWSVGASWSLHNEKFMQNLHWMNHAKLRGSYGVTGNIYQGATSFMTAVAGMNYRTQTPMSSITSPANPELTWEKTRTINIGLDFALFDARLRGALDWYRKKGEQVFSKKRLDPSKGFDSMVMNMADLKNEGVEVSLIYDWFRTKDRNGFLWTTSLTGAYNKNKITRVENPSTKAGELIASRFREGYPVNAMFSYRFAGINNDHYKGWPMWYLSDGTPTTSASNAGIDALIFSGQTDPKITAGLENRIAWNGISLSIMAVYYGGHHMRVLQANPAFGVPCTTLASYLLNAWTPDNLDTNVPGIGKYAPGLLGSETTYTDIYVQPADFIKIRNIVLGYDLPQELLSKIGVKKVSLRFQIDNPKALWVKNKVEVDPETGTLRNPTSFIFGVNFTL